MSVNVAGVSTPFLLLNPLSAMQRRMQLCGSVMRGAGQGRLNALSKASSQGGEASSKQDKAQSTKNYISAIVISASS